MCIVHYVADFTFTASYVVTYLFVIPTHNALKMVSTKPNILNTVGTGVSVVCIYSTYVRYL